MKDNQMVPTNTLWYRIKNFFRKIFIKKEIEENLESHKNGDFKENISLRNQMESYEIQEKKAKDLMSGNLAVESLSDEEVNEMITYFAEYNQKLIQDLEAVKKNFTKLRNHANE